MPSTQPTDPSSEPTTEATGDPSQTDQRAPEAGFPAALSRRHALKLGGAATLAAGASPLLAGAASATVGQNKAVTDALRPAILPRQEWAGGLPFGQLTPEEDVRFLLVHHTASTNDYGPDDVASTIRGFHSFHTGAEKGWPDVAYNFFVDRFGTIWEARAGSIESAIRGDATGGSQGFALLIALIGDHSTEPISDPAFAALAQLLAWLAERHGVDTTPGATVNFISRGSNKWPSGSEVTARTISGHREMSSTQCPGNLAFAVLDEDLPVAVTELRLGSGPLDLSTTTSSSTTTPSSSTNESEATFTTDQPSRVTSSTTERALSDTAPGDVTSAPFDTAVQQRRWIRFAWGGAGLAALAAASSALIKRRRQADRDLEDRSI